MHSKQFLLAIIWLSTSSVSVAASASREWFKLSIGEQRVGYAFFERQMEKGDVIGVQYSRIAVTQFRTVPLIERKITVRRDAAGALKSMEVSSSAGSRQDGWRSTFDGRRETMKRRIASSNGHEEIITTPATMHAPDEQFGYTKPLLTGASRTISYSYLEPSLALPTAMQASVIDDGEKAIANAIHIRIVKAVAPASIVEDVWIGKNHRILQIEQPFFGQIVRWTPCDANCDAEIDTPYDPMERLVVRSPFHVPKKSFGGPIRYVISLKNHAPLNLPVTKEQSVIRSDTGAVVTVCTDCGTEPANSAADIARFLKPNAWVQSDDKTIISFARNSTVNTRSVARRMSGLVDAVRTHMNGQVDYLGYASATEAYKSRSGDCTEFAVLLAALARADGIPTRIVVGLAYADRFSGKKDVFSPHAWVQAWDGKSWTSYDAALDGFDATHIAIAIGDGSPEQYETEFRQLANLQIEKLGLVRDR